MSYSIFWLPIWISLFFLKPSEDWGWEDWGGAVNTGVLTAGKEPTSPRYPSISCLIGGNCGFSSAAWRLTSLEIDVESVGTPLANGDISMNTLCRWEGAKAGGIRGWSPFQKSNFPSWPRDVLATAVLKCTKLFSSDEMDFERIDNCTNLPFEVRYLTALWFTCIVSSYFTPNIW